MPNDEPVFFQVRPPFRCFARPALSKFVVCGARACWMRPSTRGFETQFFCDQHRGKDDIPATSDAVFRRLTVSLSVFFAAAEAHPPHAAEEAIARLEALIQHAGGVLDVHGVLQQVGQGGALPAAPLATDRRRGQR